MSAARLARLLDPFVFTSPSTTPLRKPVLWRYDAFFSLSRERDLGIFCVFTI